MKRRSTDGKCQRIRLSMTRRPLNRLFRRAVQCRDQTVVGRLYDRDHPNKVSMKRKRKREGKEAGSQLYLYTSGQAQAVSEELGIT